MSKNKPTKQHYVPACYLREWAKIPIFSKKDPFVWIIDKKTKNKRRDKVKNVLTSNDLYTIKINGKKNYVIEETLANLEGKYAKIFKEKISEHTPLNDKEHIILCAFTAVMMQRTLRHKNNLENLIDQIISHSESLEKAHGLKSSESERLKRVKKDMHKQNVFSNLEKITNILLKMGLAFLCAEKGAKYITSDDPCNLFNSDLQWQKFYRPGLAQKNVQVTLPLSPKIMLCLSWTNLRGYIKWNKKLVEDSNRMLVGHCYQYFISSNPRIRRMWYRKYPLDLFFIIKIIKNKTKFYIIRLKTKFKHKHVSKK